MWTLLLSCLLIARRSSPPGDCSSALAMSRQLSNWVHMSWTRISYSCISAFNWGLSTRFWKQLRLDLQKYLSYSALACQLWAKDDTILIISSASVRLYGDHVFFPAYQSKSSKTLSAMDKVTELYLYFSRICNFYCKTSHYDSYTVSAGMDFPSSFVYIPLLNYVWSSFNELGVSRAPHQFWVFNINFFNLYSEESSMTWYYIIIMTICRWGLLLIIQQLTRKI